MMVRCAVLLIGVLASVHPILADEAPKPKPLTLGEGKFGKALDAAFAPATIEGSPRLGQPPITVECWALLRSKHAVNVLIASDERSSSSHWALYSAAKSGEFGVALPAVEPSEVRSKVDICDGKWHYLAFSYDGATAALFVDGKRVAEQAVTKKAIRKAETGPLMIGALGDGKGRVGCDGLIDDVRISGTIRDIVGIPTGPLPFDPKTMLLHRFDRLDDLVVDPAWTPPPVAGNVPEWMKLTDKDWVDARFREMDTGPFLHATFEYPTWRGAVHSYKGTAIRLNGGKAGVLFDRNQLRLACGWNGGWLQHSSRRFALLNTPRPAGEVTFASASGPGWSGPKGEWTTSSPATSPLPHEWAKYRGHYLHADRTILSYTVGGVEVLDSPGVVARDGLTTFTRTIEVMPTARELRLLVCDLPGPGTQANINGVHVIAALRAKEETAVALSGEATLRLADGPRVEVVVAPHREPVRFTIWIAQGGVAEGERLAARVKAASPPEALAPLTKPGPARWTTPIITKGVVSREDKPYVVDTITMPYDNPHKALMFASGIDFLPNGDLVVCTAHGDVWLVKHVDDKLERLTWKRFATGLYQPLGLKVVDGLIHVLERGQLTRLHDRNGDGEADFYECFNNDWHTGGGEHSFDTCLEIDPQGNFYFFKTGDPHTPTGGCLLRVSKDGSKAEIYSTGFRHPIGLSVSPSGLVTGADQEGNWMPSTRIDHYRQGGFYGDLRAHHRDKPPTTYDPPLCWLPRELDNSAGGQVWLPPGQFGPLGGQMLHLSYGRCAPVLILRQQVGEAWQGGGFDLGVTFLSGAMRGHFHERDNCLYVAGLRGWQNAAQQDGCVQRLRYTGKPVQMPTAMAVRKDGIQLTFHLPLDAKAASDARRYRVERWNYRWSAEYGSKRWSAANPDRIGQDVVPIREVKLLPDGRSVMLKIDDLKPVMQMQIRFPLGEKPGNEGAIYSTVHAVK